MTSRTQYLRLQDGREDDPIPPEITSCGEVLRHASNSQLEPPSSAVMKYLANTQRPTRPEKQPRIKSITNITADIAKT